MKYPMKLTYSPIDIIWGGTKLKERYNKSSSFDKIAESWELTVRGDYMSHIKNGLFAEKSLGELLENNPEFVGSDFEGGAFPLLIKFIDAADNLSVQVHPDDEYAKDHEGTLGKNEMWYIVEADEDASLIYGLAENITKEDFVEAVKNNKLSSNLLNKVKIKKGDVYYIPAGQVHSICRGAFIAEIQQNSNVTYRIYDYDRVGNDGKPRELHKEKAIDTVKAFTSAEIRAKAFEGNTQRRSPFITGEILCDCKYFRVTRLLGNAENVFTVDEKSFASLTFTDAENVTVTAGDVSTEIFKGDTVFIPAGTGVVCINGKYDVIIAEM